MILVMDVQEIPLDEPWRAIPTRIGDLIRPHVPALSDEVIGAIRARVPAYRRPLRGRFGAGIRSGVEEALNQFADLVADPELDRSRTRRRLPRPRPRRVPRAALARRAARRVPARGARRRGAACRRSRSRRASTAAPWRSWPRPCSPTSTSSRRSRPRATPRRSRPRRASASAAAAGSQRCCSSPTRTRSSVAAAAADADWEPPARLAALAWSGPGRRLRARLPADVPGGRAGRRRRAGARPDRRPRCAGPRRDARAGRSATASRCSVRRLSRGAIARSVDRARATLRLIGEGVVSATGFELADDHLGALVAHGDERTLAELARRRLRAARRRDAGVAGAARRDAAQPGSTTRARSRPSRPSFTCTRRPSATGSAACASSSATRSTIRRRASSSR